MWLIWGGTPSVAAPHHAPSVRRASFPLGRSEFHEHADDLRLAALSYTADALATATPGQGPTEADLEELKALVNNTDSTRVPPSTIHALVVGSRPGLALQIVRSRGVAHRSSLNEARLWLEVRLAAGVFAEATLEVRRGKELLHGCAAARTLLFDKAPRRRPPPATAWVSVPTA